MRVAVGTPEPEPEPEPPGGPDLVVDSPSASDADPAPGGRFTLSATVRNRGDGDAAATTLRYYRSDNSTISTSDIEVGTDPVSALAASGSAGLSIGLRAPTDTGTYYYGACADPVAGESDGSNNCSRSARVAVGTPEPEPEPEPPGGPDLVVDSPSASDADPAPGGRFTLSATVRNRGDGDAAATTLRYYRSADAAISTSDIEVGTDPVPALPASGSAAPSISLSAPADAGTYYYGACADAVPGESDTSNNCSGSARVAVGAPEPEPEPPGGPDLAVESASASDADPAPGGPFTLSATVRNRGDGDAAATTLRYYRSADAAISTSDIEVGTDPVPALPASGSAAPSIPLSAPADAGAYYYRACADAVPDESDASNNCSSAVRVTVAGPAAPDLVLFGLKVRDYAGGLDPGELFRLEVGVRNAGDADADATFLRYHHSPDATISSADDVIGGGPVDALAPSETAAGRLSKSAAAQPGFHYYGACVDAVPGESDATNNCAGTRVEVLAPGPDLVVVSPAVSDGGPNAGAAFTLSATVRNRSGGPSPATTLRYYRSSNDHIGTGDHEVGTDPVAALAASGGSRLSTTLRAPTEVRTYYYGACVDAVPRETEPHNNCSSAVQIEPRRPDLVARSASISETWLETGEEFTLSATVRNEGAGDAAASTLRHYLARRFGHGYADDEIVAEAVEALAASGGSDHSLTMNAPSDAFNRHYYRACVDVVPHETDKKNNCTAWVRYHLTNPQGHPDVYVSYVRNWIPGGGVRPGFRQDITATVNNHGDAKSAPTTLRWYVAEDAFPRSDETGSQVFTPENEFRTRAIGQLYPLTVEWDTRQVLVPEEPGDYQYGFCVDPVPGEVERENCISAWEMEIRVLAPN